jgi:ATP-dependent DNA helicase RecQ
VRRRVSLRGPKKSAIASDLPTEATGLFEKLREWRAAIAREQGVPAYIIFGDATLRGIALSRPDSRAELAGISGVGEKKLDAYGEQLLEVVAAAQ